MKQKTKENFLPLDHLFLQFLLAKAKDHRFTKNQNEVLFAHLAKLNVGKATYFTFWD